MSLKSLANECSNTKACKLAIQVRTACKVSNMVFGDSVQYEQSTVTIFYVRCSMFPHSLGKKNLIFIKIW